jgi:hypothetical protein
MEFLSHRKRQVTSERGETVYKQVCILDMDGLSSAHFGSKFRGPIKEIIVLLQEMYPVSTVRTADSSICAWKAHSIEMLSGRQTNELV